MCKSKRTKRSGCINNNTFTARYLFVFAEQSSYVKTQHRTYELFTNKQNTKKKKNGPTHPHIHYAALQALTGQLRIRQSLTLIGQLSVSRESRLVRKG